MKELARYGVVLFVFLSWAMLLVYIFGCAKHEEKATQQDTAAHVALRDHYCATITDDIYLARCDKLTFKALTAAYCPKDNFDLDDLEWDRDGKWYRDNMSCLADMNGDGQPDSKSECSGDGFIGLAHYWISKGPDSLPQVNRTLEYLNSNNWICGEGDREITNVRHLEPFLLSVQAYLSGGLEGLALLNSDGVVADHNKYLTALAVHATGRMQGEIDSSEKALIAAWYAGDKESCVFTALYHRYHDGDQGEALAAMEGFPSEVELRDGYGGWGSMPDATAQVLCTGILEGV